MDTDEEQLSDYDSEPAAPMVEKRQYHNQLERERRNVLKSSFEMLRCAVPSLVGNSRAQTARAKILKKAIDYIHRTRPKRQACEMEIKELRDNNKKLKEQIQAMEALEKSTDLQSLQKLARTINETKFKKFELEPIHSDYDDDSEEGGGDSGEGGGDSGEGGGDSGEGGEDSGEGGGDSDNDPDEAYSEEEYSPASKRAKPNWSPEVWDNEDDVEENPEPQQNWSVSVTETETESETSDSSDSYVTE